MSSQNSPLLTLQSFTTTKNSKYYLVFYYCSITFVDYALFTDSDKPGSKTHFSIISHHYHSIITDLDLQCYVVFTKKFQSQPTWERGCLTPHNIDRTIFCHPPTCFSYAFYLASESRLKDTGKICLHSRVLLLLLDLTASNDSEHFSF